MCDTIKKRGSLDLSPIRQPEAFACPPRQDEQRRTHAKMFKLSPLKRVETAYKHIKTRPVALTLTELKVAKFQVVKTEAQVTLYQ